jgi:hypothetical protein
VDVGVGRIHFQVLLAGGDGAPVCRFGFGPMSGGPVIRARQIAERVVLAISDGRAFLERRDGCGEVPLVELCGP